VRLTAALPPAGPAAEIRELATPIAWASNPIPGMSAYADAQTGGQGVRAVGQSGFRPNNQHTATPGFASRAVAASQAWQMKPRIQPSGPWQHRYPNYGTPKPSNLARLVSLPTQLKL